MPCTSLLLVLPERDPKVKNKMYTIQRFIHSYIHTYIHTSHTYIHTYVTEHFIVFFIAFDKDLHDKLYREDPMDHFLYACDPKVSGVG